MVCRQTGGRPGPSMRAMDTPAEPNGRQYTILLADANARMREAMVGLLARTFPAMAVVPVESGAAAMAAVAAHQPLLAVIDLQLPDEDGIAVARAIARTALASIVIVVTPGEPTERTASQALAAGALACIAKERLFVELGPLAVRLAAMTRH